MGWAYSKIFKKLRMIAFVVTLIAVMASLGPAPSWALFDQELTTSEQDLAASLSGFEPGAKVTYAVLKTDQSIRNGEATIDDQGRLLLSFGLKPEEIAKDFEYSFAIEGQNNAVSFRLVRDPKTGALQISGTGFGELSDIEIDTGVNLVNSRSDWAGVFEQTGIELPNTDETTHVKVAFYGANIAQGLADANNPSILDIQFAPGGGGPGAAGTITYLPLICIVNPLPSYCDVNRIADQMRDIVRNFDYPLQVMTDQLGNNAMAVTAQIGRFLDAKEQLEVQRDYQALKVQAHKDYHPSEQMCRVGSYMKSLSTAGSKSDHDALAMNKILTDQYQNKQNSGTKSGEVSDLSARLKQYREVYCDPQDNGGSLFFMCEHDQDDDLANSNLRQNRMDGIGAENTSRMNKDIDSYRTLEYPLTLDVNFAESEVTDDEEDISALAKNLFWSQAFEIANDENMKENAHAYRKARNLMALNTIAHNSFAHIVGMKSEMPDPAPGVTPGWAHMKTMMREFGVSDDDIALLLGRNPSYYAQMDVLTKKVYQNPDFYTNLYDKPVNVDRIMASMDAIQLMQMRDHYEGMLRREMLSSAMIKEALFPRMELLNATIRDLR